MKVAFTGLNARFRPVFRTETPAEDKYPYHTLWNAILLLNPPRTPFSLRQRQPPRSTRDTGISRRLYQLCLGIGIYISYFASIYKYADILPPR